MKTNFKAYGTPHVEIVRVDASDILTLSNAGFAGEEHEFELPMN